MFKNNIYHDGGNPIDYDIKYCRKFHPFAPY